jgi:hypothetical protein
MNRRRFFSVGALAPFALAQGAVSTEAAAVNRDPQFFGDPVTVLRLEEDGSITLIDTIVLGAICRPRNDARERRVDMGLGENHWDIIAGEILGPRDESYYEEQRVSLSTRYWDDVWGEVRVNDLHHVADPGSGIHRWVLPDEDWQGIEWKWSLYSVEPTIHFSWRQRYGKEKTWMWS